MNEFNSNSLNGNTLAYFGDVVIELYVRELLVKTGIGNTGRLNKLAKKFVRATSQSQSIENILPVLTPKELSIYKRGRNAHGISCPKSAEMSEYRRATGFEALMGYLYLSNEAERAKNLFDIAFEKQINELTEEEL